jgi:hypothetical protein
MRTAIQTYLLGSVVNLALAVGAAMLLFWNDDFLISISRFGFLPDYAILLISSCAHFAYLRRAEWRIKLAILGTSLPVNFIAILWLAMKISGDTL